MHADRDDEPDSDREVRLNCEIDDCSSICYGDLINHRFVNETAPHQSRWESYTSADTRVSMSQSEDSDPLL